MAHADLWIIGVVVVVVVAVQRGLWALLVLRRRRRGAPTSATVHVTLDLSDFTTLLRPAAMAFRFSDDSRYVVIVHRDTEHAGLDGITMVLHQARKEAGQLPRPPAVGPSA